MHPRPISATLAVPIRRVLIGIAARTSAGTAAAAADASAPRLELLLESVEHLVARQNLRDARVGLPSRADRREELAVLQLDPVHRDVDGGYVDFFVAAGQQVVVAGHVGAVVADVAEERAKRTVVVERQRERADRARGAAELDRHIHRDTELR